MSALLDFAERHMVLTWIVVLMVGGLVWSAIGAIENVAIGRLKVRAFEADRKAKKDETQPEAGKR